MNTSPVQKSAAHLCTLLLLCFHSSLVFSPAPLSYLSCKDCVVPCQCFVIKGEFIKYCVVPVLSIETLLHFNWPHFINKVEITKSVTNVLKCHYPGFGHVVSDVTECK